MKILHCALSCFYIEGYNYQENVLPKLHTQMGHEVLMLASCVSFDDKGAPCLLQPTRYRSADGFDVIRLPYRKGFRGPIMRRVRVYPGVYKILEDFNPDVIYFHGCSGLELHTIARYKKKHPGVVLFIDSHADRNNSASSRISLIVQHKMMYKPALQRALRYTEKVLCPSMECMDFCAEVYGVPQELLEFYPLGGTIVSLDDQAKTRQAIREKEGVPEDCVVFTHSGKMDAKKRTLEIIEAFRAVENSNFRLWIIGVLADDVKDKVLTEVAKDSRISYLGWKKSEELVQYLCATDYYVQPGGQSATMQNAMCSGCALMLYPHKSHQPYMQGSGYYIKDVDDMVQAFRDVSEHPEKIAEHKAKSYAIACDILDYNKMAARVCVEKVREAQK